MITQYRNISEVLARNDEVALLAFILVSCVVLSFLQKSLQRFQVNSTAPLTTQEAHQRQKLAKLLGCDVAIQGRHGHTIIRENRRKMLFRRFHFGAARTWTDETGDGPLAEAIRFFGVASVHRR